MLNAVTALLGLAFVAAGGIKLNAPGDFTGMFAAWGLPGWTVAWSGGVETALGLLLFYAPSRRYGALGLMAWMALFAPLQLRADQLGGAGASAAVFLLCAVAAVTQIRERGWSLPRLPRPLADPPRRIGPGLLRAVELVGVSFLIRFAVGGMLFWTALPVLAWGHARGGRADAPRSDVAGTVLLYLLVLGIGVSGLWAFVGHTFMSGQVGESVGWSPSPFQRELAFYHLGVGVAGILCLWIRDRFWLATGLIVTVFLYGAGLVHLQEYLATGNAAPANWGPGVLFGNALVPTALAALLLLRFRRRPPAH